MSRRDPEKERRLADYVARQWSKRKRRAVAEIANMQNDHTPWEDRTVAHVTNMKLAELFSAEQRAERAAQNGPNLLGVVMMVPQIGNATEWEAFARDQTAIEVEAKSALPGQVVHGSRGAVGSLPEQLGENLQGTQNGEAPSAKGGEADEEKEGKGQGNRLLTPPAAKRKAAG